MYLTVQSVAQHMNPLPESLIFFKEYDGDIFMEMLQQLEGGGGSEMATPGQAPTKMWPLSTSGTRIAAVRSRLIEVSTIKVDGTS